MKQIIELDGEKELRALKKVLEKISDVDAQVIVCMKQAIRQPDGYEQQDISTTVLKSNVQVNLNENLIYVTIPSMGRPNVKEIQQLWHNVLQRGTQMYVKGQANDYFLTFDAVYLDEIKEKSYLLCSHCTPIFCSSDGDADLTLVFRLQDVYISIDTYNAHDTEYLAAIAEEEGQSIRTASEDEYNDNTLDEHKDVDELTDATRYIK